MSKGLQVKRSTSEMVPKSKGPQSKGLQKSNVTDESKYKTNTTKLQLFTPHVPVVFGGI